MIIIPFFLNSLQFWIQDSILKANKQKNIIFHKPGRYQRSLTHRPVRRNKIFASPRISRRTESFTSTKENVVKIDLTSAI